MKKYFLPLIIVVLFSGCGSKKRITDARDYKMYLDHGIINERKQSLDKERLFWQHRLQKDSGNWVDMVKLATSHQRLFKRLGNVNDLNTADSLFKASSEKLKRKDPDLLFALSQNAITQHKFSDAALHLAAAERAGGDSYTMRLLDFDTKLELGEKMMAKQSISLTGAKKSFDYLVRLSKLEDQEGNSGKAILLMEQAFEKAEYGSSDRYCWALSNLGDMYGHAGRTKEAYAAYLNVLQKDNSYSYALKGIAWIAFSHDQNTTEAKRIYQFILSCCKMPDLWLALAEIAEWEGDHHVKDEYIRQFMDEVKRPEYGNMYNKYLIQLYTEELKDYDKALRLAQTEIQQRATPETYDWLAWVYFNKGEIKEALSIARGYVYKRNFEPGALWHTANIFLASGEHEKARELLEECKASSFELGPVKARMVERLLSELITEKNE